MVFAIGTGVILKEIQEGGKEQEDRIDPFFSVEAGMFRVPVRASFFQEKKNAHGMG